MYCAWREDITFSNTRKEHDRLYIMSSYNLDYTFDENLRELPVNPEDMYAYVSKQLQLYKLADNPLEQTKVLGEAGVYLRILRKLDEAEKYLIEAGNVISQNLLPISVKVSQQIRLAHVYQWKGNFKISNKMFDEILKVCEVEKNLGALIDFSWQHAGKNYFDQKKWPLALEAFEKALKLRKLRGAPQEQIDSSIKSIEKVKFLIKSQVQS